jgi:hypothetical protein
MHLLKDAPLSTRSLGRNFEWAAFGASTGRSENQTRPALQGRDQPSQLTKAAVQSRKQSQRPVVRAQRTQSIERPVSPLAEQRPAAALSIASAKGPIVTKRSGSDLLPASLSPIPGRHRFIISP